MTKPITVARQEFNEKLVALVNESKLPAFVVREALATAYEGLTEVEKAQLEADRKAWEESQKGEDNG